MGMNPLIGTKFKPMFVDMSEPYNKDFRAKFMELSFKHKVKI